MMNDIKRAVRLIRLGDQFTVYMVMAILWFVFGEVLSVFSVNTQTGHLMLIFSMFAPMMLIQGFAALEAVGMAAASKRRKFIAIKGQNILTIGGMGIMFLLVILEATVKYYIFHMGAKEFVGGTILCAGLSAAVLLIYMPLVNKTFIGGVAVFLQMYMAYTAAGSLILEKWMPSYSVGMLLGIAAFALGSVTGCLFRRWLYKVPVSKYSLGAEMRKYM